MFNFRADFFGGFFSGLKKISFVYFRLGVFFKCFANFLFSFCTFFFFRALVFSVFRIFFVELKSFANFAINNFAQFFLVTVFHIFSCFRVFFFSSFFLPHGFEIFRIFCKNIFSFFVDFSFSANFAGFFPPLILKT